jgi:hypothetical protein
MKSEERLERVRRWLEDEEIPTKVLDSPDVHWLVSARYNAIPVLVAHTHPRSDRVDIRIQLNIAQGERLAELDPALQEQLLK